MLRAIALIAGLAILLWSLGLPSLRFAEAVNITDVSDTLTDSAPSAVSDHTIKFTTPSGVANGATTTITFQSDYDLSAIDYTDIDMSTTSGYTIAGDCSGSEQVAATVSGQVLQLVFCPGDGGSLPTYATTTILIGHNATGGTANAQISNPSTEGSYRIDIATPSDSGTTRVAIINGVAVTASVDTIFIFLVGGFSAGTSVNGDTTTGKTTTTTIPFGKLSDGVATVTAQRLTVKTNAQSGYVVTAQVDHALRSSTGAEIDGFQDGSDTNTPTTWTAPTAVLDQPNTYGHWGITSDDATTTRLAQFASGKYIAASTSPRIVMSHNGSVNGAGVGVGTTTVGFKVQISALQEAGDDYQAVLTYIATPTF
jgi:hypothetical protein